MIRFYADPLNLERYPPALVIYDGGNAKSEEELKRLFGNNLVFITDADREQTGLRGVHSSTSKLIHEQLDKADVDYLLCFGDKILQKSLVSAYSRRLVNFHPSLLPAFAGLNAIDAALQENAVFLGNTAHFIDEGVDTGEIILQTAMLAEDYASYEDVLELQIPMIKMVLRDLAGFKVSDEEISACLPRPRSSYMMPKNCHI